MEKYGKTWENFSFTKKPRDSAPQVGRGDRQISVEDKAIRLIHKIFQPYDGPSGCKLRRSYKIYFACAFSIYYIEHGVMNFEFFFVLFPFCDFNNSTWDF